MKYIIHLSQLFYQLLVNDNTPQEQLSQILSIFRNTDMLAFYKTNAFKNEMQQGLSIVLLQVGDEVWVWKIEIIEWQPFDFDKWDDICFVWLIRWDYV